MIDFPSFYASDFPIPMKASSLFHMYIFIVIFSVISIYVLREMFADVSSLMRNDTALFTLEAIIYSINMSYSRSALTVLVSA